MAVQVLCPQCQASLKAATEPAQNAKLKCPKCQHTFRYSPEMLKPLSLATAPSAKPSGVTPPPVAPASVSAPTSTAASVVPPPVNAEFALKARRGRRWPVVLPIAVVLVVAVCAVAYYLRRPSDVTAVVDNSGSSFAPAGAPSGPSRENKSGVATSSIALAQRPAPSGSAQAMTLPTVLDAGGWFERIVFSADGTTMVGVRNSRLEIWNASTGKKIKTLPDELGFVPSLIVSPDGQVLAVASHIEDDWSCKLWLLPDGIELGHFVWQEEVGGGQITPTGQTYSPPMAFSPSSELFAVPADEQTIVVWDLTQGKHAHRLKGHTGRIDSLSFTADGKKLLSSSGEIESIRLWSLDSGSGQELTRDRLAYDSLITADEKMIVTRSFDQISVWNLSAGGGLQLDHHIDEQSRHIELWPDENTLAIYQHQTGRPASKVVLWDISAGKLMREIDLLLRANDEIEGIQLSPDGRTIAALTVEGVALFDALTGQVRAKYSTVPDDAESIHAFSFNDAGDMLVISMDNGKLRFESTTSGSAGAAVVSESLATIRPPAEPSGIHFSKDGKTLVTSLWPEKVNFETPQLQQILKNARTEFEREFRKWGGATQQQRMNLSVDFFERQVLPKIQPVADREHWGPIAAIWDVESLGKPRRIIRQPLISRPDLETDEHKVTIIMHGEIETLLNPYQSWNGTNPDLSLCDPGDDGLLWFNRSQGFVITDYKTAQDVVVATRPTEWSACCLAADGRRMATAAMDTARQAWRLLLIDIEQGEERLVRPISTYIRPGAMRFSPDSVTFAAVIPPADPTSPSGHVLKLWDTATGLEPDSPLNVPLSTNPESFELSPDGIWLTYADLSGPQIIDLATGQRRSTVVNDAVYLPTFSPDSRELAVVVPELNVGEAMYKIHLVDLANGQIRRTINGFTTVVQSLAYSPDGKLLCIGGGAWGEVPGQAALQQSSAENATSELKLFDVQGGDLRAVLGGHSDVVTKIVFSRDGKRLASLSWDKTVKIWDVGQLLTSPVGSPTRRLSRPPMAKIKLPTPAQVVDPSRPTTVASTDQRVEPRTTEAPSRLEPSQSTQPIRNSLGMQLVIVPPGKLQQGSPASDHTAEANERPVREVAITKAFAIGRTEVTVGQFRRFTETVGYRTDAEKGDGGTGYDAAAQRYIEENRAEFNWSNPGFQQTDDHPAVNISWNDAVAFCQWLTQFEGVTYRLPTEAEWEYACRAGAATRFWTGDQDGSLRGAENIGDQSLRQAWSEADWVQTWDDRHAFTAPVGSFKPNAFQLYDMHGNAGEWTADWHADEAYRESAGADPQGPSTGEARVFRGGSWYSEPQHARSAYRPGVYTPELRGADTGFRVVYELP